MARSDETAGDKTPNTAELLRDLSLTEDMRNLLITLVSAAKLNGAAWKVDRRWFGIPPGFSPETLETGLQKLAEVGPFPNHHRLLMFNRHEILLDAEAIQLVEMIRGTKTTDTDKERFVVACYEYGEGGHFDWRKIAKQVGLRDEVADELINYYFKELGYVVTVHGSTIAMFEKRGVEFALSLIAKRNEKQAREEFVSKQLEQAVMEKRRKVAGELTDHERLYLLALESHTGPIWNDVRYYIPEPDHQTLESLKRKHLSEPLGASRPTFWTLTAEGRQLLPLLHEWAAKRREQSLHAGGQPAVEMFSGSEGVPFRVAPPMALPQYLRFLVAAKDMYQGSERISIPSVADIIGCGIEDALEFVKRAVRENILCSGSDDECHFTEWGRNRVANMFGEVEANRKGTADGMELIKDQWWRSSSMPCLPHGLGEEIEELGWNRARYICALAAVAADEANSQVNADKVAAAIKLDGTEAGEYQIEFDRVRRWLLWSNDGTVTLTLSGRLKAGSLEKAYSSAAPNQARSAKQRKQAKSTEQGESAAVSKEQKLPNSDGAETSNKFTGLLGQLWNGLLVSARLYKPNIFAIGLVGVAFAVAIILAVLKPQLAVIGIALSFAGMIILLQFKRMAEGKKQTLEGKVLTWVVIVLVSLFLFSLFLAFVFDWPPGLARRLS